MDRGQEIRELKLGASFTNPNARTVYHTIKCKSINFYICLQKLPHINLTSWSLSLTLDDFKPASVDAHKEATLETGSKNEVTVTVPHLGRK
jgi:ELL-associated factor